VPTTREPSGTWDTYRLWEFPALGIPGLRGSLIEVGGGDAPLRSVTATFGSHFGGAVVIRTSVIPDDWPLSPDEEARGLLDWVTGVGVLRPAPAEAAPVSLPLQVGDRQMSATGLLAGPYMSVFADVDHEGRRLRVGVGARNFGLAGQRLVFVDPTTFEHRPELTLRGPAGAGIGTAQ
jgi:hypothetical protein